MTLKLTLTMLTPKELKLEGNVKSSLSFIISSLCLFSQIISPLSFYLPVVTYFLHIGMI